MYYLPWWMQWAQATALIATTVFIWQSHAMAFGSAGCEQRNLLARATSPDGTWVASIYNNVCSDGAFVTTIDDTVEITRSTRRLPQSHRPEQCSVWMTILLTFRSRWR